MRLSPLSCLCRHLSVSPLAPHFAPPPPPARLYLRPTFASNRLYVAFAPPFNFFSALLLSSYSYVQQMSPNSIKIYDHFRRTCLFSGSSFTQ